MASSGGLLTEWEKRRVWRRGSARGSYRSKNSHRWETKCLSNYTRITHALSAESFFKKLNIKSTKVNQTLHVTFVIYRYGKNSPKFNQINCAADQNFSQVLEQDFYLELVQRQNV